MVGFVATGIPEVKHLQLRSLFEFRHRFGHANRAVKPALPGAAVEGMLDTKDYWAEGCSLSHTAPRFLFTALFMKRKSQTKMRLNILLSRSIALPNLEVASR